MAQCDKAKNAGKYIVILLCFAIVFFLLLPFLEDSVPASGQTAGKKASPQIFTSNPLSELVRKVYSMFAKNQNKHPKRPLPGYAASLNNDILTEASEPMPRYAATENTEEINGTTGSSSTYFPQSYDYGEAGFINEDGEWVLVRQTAPDASQRGMHEINSSDSAYDKLVRLERSAKYMPRRKPEAPPIPDSKWARLFNPIKKLFGMRSQNQADSADMWNEESYALADSSEGLDGSMRRPTERFARPANINMPSFPGVVTSATGNEGFSWADIFSPEDILDGVIQNLQRMGNDSLDPQAKNEFIKRLHRLSEEQKKFIKDSFYRKMQMMARNEPADNLLAQTFSCGEAVSGTYSSKKASGQCDWPQAISQKEMEQQARESTQQALKNQQESLKFLAQIADRKTPAPQDLQVKMVVLLGQADGANPFAEYSRMPLPIDEGISEEERQAIEQENQVRQRQDETLRKFYDFMAREQGCGSEACYAIGSAAQADPSMANRIISSGVEYDGDPLQLAQGMIDRFAQQQLSQAKTEEEKEQAKYIQQDLNDFPPYYLYYTHKNMEELNQRNTSPAPNTRPEDPFLYYVPTAGNAAALPQSVIPSPGIVFYGGGVLDEDTTTMKQAGDTLRNMYIQRNREAKQLGRQALKNTTDQAFPVLLQQGELQTFQQIFETNQKAASGAH